jgi:uroporphyrinogen-III decarboxylase
MTSRERVIAALQHKTPDRTPRDLWALPYISLFREQELESVRQEYPSDISRPELSPGSGDTELERLSKSGQYTDEWGSVWEVGEPGIIGEVKKPALADWQNLATFQPPWALLKQRDRDHINRMCDTTDAFMLSPVCARPFERLQFLRGTEPLFMDLAYESTELTQLISMIHDYYLEEVKYWANTNVDAIFLMDDWGTNTALLIDPEMWRAIFKPLYRDYCKIIHDAGKFAFMHSDGNIQSIYPDLIEVGIDALNSQLFCMDFDTLAQYKGQITFWGEIDRQQVLPFGNADDVRAAVQRVNDFLGTGNGGLIAQCEWGKDNSQENIEAVFEAWNNVG